MTAMAGRLDHLADGSTQVTHDVQAWLVRLAERLAAAHGALHLVEGIVLWQESVDWLPVALWPARADGLALLDVADQVREARSGLVGGLERGVALGYPVRDLSPETGPTTIGVVALWVTRVAAEESPRDGELMPLMQHLEDAVAGLERDLLARHHAGVRAQRAQLGDHLTLLAAVLEQPSFDAAAMQLTTRLAAQLDAERVSLGWRRGSRTRLRQISHSARFNRRMNRVRATEAAMDEALDQRRCVLWPPPESPDQTDRPVDRAHGTLCQMTDVPYALSVPCLDDGRPLGALTVETEHPLDDRQVGSLESLMALCARALEEKRRNDRALPLKALDSLGDQAGRLLGPGHLGYKLTAIILVGVVAFAYFATGTERLSADASLKSEVQRVVAAPFQGYLEEARARAGDRVEEDEVLVAMDTRELRLEQLQARSELTQLAGEAQQLRAEGERASLNVIEAQREQTEAELELIESRLGRANLRAPFDGVVVSGDLTQQLGSAVEAGEELFRIAPEGDYRVELEVDEARIDDIDVGQRGDLVLSAMTDTPLGFEIRRITPETRRQEGSNRFVVEARLDESPSALRPGMEGVGRIELDEQRLVTTWTRELVDWLRLSAWRWWG